MKNKKVMVKTMKLRIPKGLRNPEGSKLVENLMKIISKSAGIEIVKVDKNNISKDMPKEVVNAFKKLHAKKKKAVRRSTGKKNLGRPKSKVKQAKRKVR